MQLNKMEKIIFNWHKFSHPNDFIMPSYLFLSGYQIKSVASIELLPLKGRQMHALRMCIKNSKNKAISLMRGKSPLSEFILEIIKSNNSLKNFKEFGKGDNFILSKYYFVLFLHVYFNEKGKTKKIGLFITITLKFAILTHH